MLLAPAIGLLEKIVCLLFPARAEEEEDTAEIDRLEERFIEHPAIAMEQSRFAMNSMARKTEANLGRAFSILEKYSEPTFQLIQEKEQVIDRYEDKLGTYLVKITQRELTHDQTKEISKFLHTISDFNFYNNCLAFFLVFYYQIWSAQATFIIRLYNISCICK